MIDVLYEYQINLIFRMIIACLCGVAIGTERKNRAKEAGMRTHCIVACASAMMMIISKYAFSDVITAYLNSDVRLDPSRMAQGIVTGVGFLGAGIIYVQRSTIKGLTTAAGIWATSGIGMAIGSGMYIIGISATIIILAVQIILHKSSSFMVMHKMKIIKIYGVIEDNFQEQTTQMLKNMNISVSEVSCFKYAGGGRDYKFYCEMPSNINEEKITDEFNYCCSVDISR